MKKIYICSPYRGDIEKNKRNARRYCLLALKQGHFPIAPHLIFTEFLDDDVPEEREMGLQLGLEMLDLCNEVWVFGRQISEGMQQEILYAKTKPYKLIRYFSTDCQEISDSQLSGGNRV